jgi:hypothetical protein
LLGIGAAYGTAKSGIGIAGVGTFRPDLIMKVCRPASTDVAKPELTIFNSHLFLLSCLVLLQFTRWSSRS